MKKFRFLIPRAVLFAVLCLGLWISSAVLARFSIQQSEKNFTHGLDTDEVEIDWQNSSVALSNVTVGNPDEDPMYLEMDKLTLKLDPNAIINRRLVVRDGVITNLHLMDSRLEDHEEKIDGQTASAFSGTTEVVRQTLSDRLSQAVRDARPVGVDYQTATTGATWWQSIQPMIGPVDSVTENSPTATAFKSKWQSQIEACRTKAQAIQSQIAILKNDSKKSTNPLRSQTQTLQSLKSINDLTAQVIDIQSQMKQIQAQAEAELLAISNADEARIRAMASAITLPQPSPAMLTAKIVSNQQIDDVQSMMKWVDWAGNLVPNLQIEPESIRGRNVSFSKTTPSSLQVDQLTLVGVTDVGGNYYRFMGRLNNFSNSPNTQDEPTSLTLRAQGPQHVIVNALYDRRGKANKTFINIKTPDLMHGEAYLPPATSANALGLGLRISPTLAYSQISLTLEDSKISGHVTIRHSNAKIQLTDGQVQDATLAGLINYELSEFDQYETVYQLTGNVDQVVAVPSCDLGQKIALAFDNATKNHLNNLNDLRIAQQQSICMKSNQELSNWLSQQSGDVHALIQHNRTQIASTEGAIEQGQDQSLRLR